MRIVFEFTFFVVVIALGIRFVRNEILLKQLKSQIESLKQENRELSNAITSEDEFTKLMRRDTTKNKSLIVG